MNIFITLDYEIYFGKNTGTVDRCLLEPTEMLFSIAQKHNVHFTFFVDCGFLLKLKHYSEQYPEVQKDYNAVIAQLKKLSANGHDLQLHIHPHWEDSIYDGKQWVIDAKRYKLTDFLPEQINDIVKRYLKVITDISSKAVFVYRAGGWCIQPFHKLKEVLKSNGIKADSTVYIKGINTAAPYTYDFTTAPDKTSWSFEDDPAIEQPGGYFREIPISSIYVSPLFYWKLFLIGRLNPYMHKPLGDGHPIVSKGFRKKILTSFTRQSVSFDGDNVKLLDKALKQIMKKGNEFVILGHPKAVSRYSLHALDQFIDKHRSKHNFTTFSEYLNH